MYGKSEKHKVFLLLKGKITDKKTRNENLLRLYLNVNTFFLVAVFGIVRFIIGKEMITFGKWKRKRILYVWIEKFEWKLAKCSSFITCFKRKYSALN